jgi:hypothetical protein
MKTFTLLFIFGLTILMSQLVAQNPKVISFSHFYDGTKDLRVLGNCISKNVLKNNTLFLTIYVNSNGMDINAHRPKVEMRKEILYIELEDTNKVVLKREYNPKTRKYETRGYQKSAVYHTPIGGPDFQRFEFVISTVKKMPDNIYFGTQLLKACPTKPIQFEILRNDTINLINKNGQRNGFWYEFYPSGKMKTIKKYNNGSFQYGKVYDENGKETGEIYETGC